VRCTRQEPAFTAAYFEPSDGERSLYVMYYRYRMATRHRLRLGLRPEDGAWFSMHLEQLENLWRDSEPVPAWAPSDAIPVPAPADRTRTR
jgi:hypothetical protein